MSGIDFDSQLYTPITVVFQKFTPARFARFLGDRVRQIIVEVESPEVLEGTIEQINLLLARLHDVALEAADFSVTHTTRHHSDPKKLQRKPFAAYWLG